MYTMYIVFIVQC